MANQIPLSGAANASGGYLLPPEQGEILTNGILQESGAIELAGDKRATNSRKTQFGMWLGAPTAGFVGEGAAKPVTGAEFGQDEINIKKVASILMFTDEMVEDVQGGDLNVLVDSGVRSAINDVVDAHAVGKDSGTNITTSFDDALRATSSTVEYWPRPLTGSSWPCRLLWARWRRTATPTRATRASFWVSGSRGRCVMLARRTTPPSGSTRVIVTRSSGARWRTRRT